MGPRKVPGGPGKPQTPQKWCQNGVPNPQNEALQSSIFWGFQELTRATNDPLELPQRALDTGVKT